jgi:hypothetical protein
MSGVLEGWLSNQMRYVQRDEGHDLYSNEKGHPGL